MLKVGNMPQEKRALHALNRMAFGPRPGDLERVNQIGVERYIREQLDPESIPVPPELTRRVNALATLRMTPVELFVTFQLPVQQAKGDKDAQKELRQRSRVILQEAVEGRLMRAIYGPRQLQEVMTAFWFNHFNVFAGKGLCQSVDRRLRAGGDPAAHDGPLSHAARRDREASRDALLPRQLAEQRAQQLRRGAANSKASTKTTRAR